MAEQEYVIWGGYGGHNLGDEAILWALSSLLRRHKPRARQSVLIRGHLSEAAARQYAEWDIHPVSFPSFAALRLLGRATVIAGGGQLVDDKSAGWPVGWTSLVLAANRLQGHAPVLFCIGAEPVKRGVTRAMLRRFYSMAKFCVCRDEETTAVMQANGIRPSALRTARDVVFSFQRAMLPERPAKTGQMRITIVVSHDARRTPGHSATALQMAESLAASGASVRLIAHDLRHEYDMGLIDILEQQTRGQADMSIARPATVRQVLEIYADSDIVISSRMHPLILSALAGALPVAILGTAKVASLVRNLGLPAADKTLSGSDFVAFVQRANLEVQLHLGCIAERLSAFQSAVESAASEVF